MTYICTRSHVKTQRDLKIAHFQSSHNSTFSHNKTREWPMFHLATQHYRNFWAKVSAASGSSESETPVFV